MTKRACPRCKGSGEVQVGWCRELNHAETRDCVNCQGLGYTTDPGDVDPIGDAYRFARIWPTPHPDPPF